MKVLFFVLTFCVLQASAQTKARLDENTVIKDTSGNIIPYVVWKSLLGKPNYALKPETLGDPNTAYFIRRLSEQEVEARLQKMPKPRESSYFITGKKTSLFNARDLNGNKLDLKNLKGKVVVLNFWFINCQPCRMEIPELNNLVDSLAINENVVFAAVALDGKSELNTFLKTFPFKYNIVSDGRWIADMYGIQTYPTHVVIDTEGKVYFHTTGLAPNTVYWIKKSIQEVLAKAQTTVAAE